MIRVLKFDGEQGPRRFELCYQALVCGPFVKGQQEREFEQKRKEARLHRALKAISRRMSENEKDATFQPWGIDNRRLVDDGAGSVLRLEQDLLELLKKFVELFPWYGGQAVEDAVDTVDWLSMAGPDDVT